MKAAELTVISFCVKWTQWWTDTDTEETSKHPDSTGGSARQTVFKTSAEQTRGSTYPGSVYPAEPNLTIPVRLSGHMTLGINSLS